MEHRFNYNDLITIIDRHRNLDKYKKHRRGSMRATILYAIILTKARRAVVSVMARGCIMARKAQSIFISMTSSSIIFEFLCGLFCKN